MKRFIKFIPIALVVVGILYLTTQNISDNARLSEGLRAVLVKVYERLGIDSSKAWWNDKLAVRRLGHVIEYGLLGVASGIAFIDGHRNGVSGVLKAVVLCLVISVLDQCVKIFVPVRHFDVVDIGYDLIGALTGVLSVIALKVLIEGILRS